jgi:hypothetical protein
VVVGELPCTRETLLLRLLGAGRVFREAVAELAALPPEARERALVRPVLLRYRLEIAQHPGKRTSEDKEFVMSTQDIVEAWERETEAKGVSKGLEKGLEKGLQKGLQKGLLFAHRTRFGPIPQDVQRIIEATSDEQTLERWYELLNTDAEAFAAAVRAAGQSRSVESEDERATKRS